MHDSSVVKIPPYPPFTQRGDTDHLFFIKRIVLSSAKEEAGRDLRGFPIVNVFVTAFT